MYIPCPRHYYSNVITMQQFRQTECNVTTRCVCVTFIVMEKANTLFVITTETHITANNIKTRGAEQKCFYDDFYVHSNNKTYIGLYVS
jgi:hypothetical protein